MDLVLNDFVASAIKYQKISILSDGSPWRPLIDVQDMANHQRHTLSRTAKDWCQNKDNHHYRSTNTDKGLFYTSFALQRIKDKDFNRKFVVSTAIERNRYVSWL